MMATPKLGQPNPEFPSNRFQSPESMIKPIFASLALSSLVAHAGVTLGFDSTTDGFTSGSEGTVAWDAYNGGSLAVSVTSGWRAQSAYLDIGANSALKAEMDLALIHGGTLTYTIYVEQSGIQGGANPDWFESIQVGNSPAGWDQSFGSARGLLGLNGAAFPLVGTTSLDVSYPIVPGVATDDSLAQFDSSGGWYQLNLGMNSGVNVANGYAGATYYIDNLTINAVPEPSALLLGGLSLLGLLRRRRA